MKVYAVETSDIEGQSCIHEIHSSFDSALEAAKKLMGEYPECWQPYKTLSNWWYYGCDSIGIQEYELKGKLEKEVL